MRKKNRLVYRPRTRNCCYCGKAADTKEHVPPKCLLVRPYPSNLPTVAACLECNRSFSRDEEYFLLVLSQITNSHQLLAAAEKILDRSAGLGARLLNSLVVEQGLKVSVNVDQERMARVVQKIACGLVAFRYRSLIRLNAVGPVIISPHQPPIEWMVRAHTEHFQAKRWENIRRGVFSFMFVKYESRLSCLMKFYEVLFAVVHLPAIAAHRVRRRAENPTQR